MVSRVKLVLGLGIAFSWLVVSERVANPVTMTTVRAAVEAQVKPADKQKPPPLPTLKSGSAALGGGEKHSFQISLKANDYLNLIVDQQGIDVVVRLLGPDGKVVQEVDSPNGTQGPEAVFFIAEQGGRHSIEIEALEKTSRAGKYELKMEAVKTATEQNRAEVEIEKLNREVERLWVMGNYDQALPFAQQAVEKSEKTGGPETALLAKSLNNLAWVYDNKGDYTRAEPLYVRALAIREKVLGADHLEVATSLNNLGMLYYKKGDYAKAKPLLAKALGGKEKALGGDHPEVANSLNNLALLYYNNADFAQAEALNVRALAIFDKTLTVNRDVAANLNNLGLLYTDQGDYAKAEPVLVRALAIYEKTLGAEHPETAISLNNLALVSYKKGDYAQAEIFYLRALAIWEKALGPDHPSVATSLNNLASTYSKKGEYAKAEPLYVRALAIYEKTLGAEHPQVATNLNNLAVLYQDKGEYARAEPLYVRALAIWEKALGPDHPETARSLNDLAVLYQAKSDYSRAEPLLVRALALREKALGADHPDVASSFNNLAVLYREKGDFARAESLYVKALAIHEKRLGADHPTVATNLNNLAALYLDKGDYAKAEPLYKKSLAIYEKAFGVDHLKTATSLNNLAVLYRDKGDYIKAESLYLRNLAIYEKAIGMEHPDAAKTLDNLANLYHATGDYPRAEPLLMKSLRIREKVLGGEHPDVAHSLYNLAALYLDKGDYTKAEPLYLKSLAIYEKVLTDHPDVATNLSHLALLYWDKGDVGQAITFQSRSNEVSEQDLLRNLVSGSERQKLLYLNQTARNRNQTLSLHIQSAPQNPDARKVALTLVLRRKGRALDAMASAIETLRRQQNPETQKLLDDYASLVNQISVLTLRGPGEKKQKEHLADLHELETRKEKLEAEIGYCSVELKTQVTPITLDGIQKLIPPQATLLEYAIYQPVDVKTKKFGNPRYAVYLLNRSGEIKFADLGEAEPIGKAVAEFRRAVSRQPSTDVWSRKRNPSALGTKRRLAQANVKAPGRQLETLIFEPVRKLLGNSNHLLISPDGDLNLIPFAALTDKTGNYLVENYELTYLTSGRDLLRLQLKTDSRQAPFILANPNYGNGKGPVLFGEDYAPLSQLKETTEEGKFLKTLFPEAILRMDAQATKKSLQAVIRPSILHIATHGYFLGDAPQTALADDDRQRHLVLSGDPGSVAYKQLRESNPLLRSWLFFAGANTGGTSPEDDGTMTALEAAQLNLWGTKLVTLSACETGLGDVKNGEGVYGLRRALVLAGSEAQMMSLWPVSDEGTRELMVEYYTRLKAGEGRSEALRNTQLKMLKDPKRRHPFYWASFIQSGEWKKL